MTVVNEMKLENISQHPLGVAAAPVPELLCIFGTGDLGRSLGQRLLQSGYGVVYGSRRPHSCGPLPQGAQVQHLAEHNMWSLPKYCTPECLYSAHIHVFLCLKCVFSPGDEPCRSSAVSQTDLYLCS